MSTENRLLYNFVDVYSATGQSAYDAWKSDSGNSDPVEFMEFAKSGPRGIQGEQGPEGPAGKSAYELWVAKEGNEGKSEAEFLDRVLDVIYMEDSATGTLYSGKLINGVLTFSVPLKGIKVITLPTKTDYTDTEEFDPTGMVVVGIGQDGSETDVTDKVEYDRFVTTGSSEFEIRYNDFGTIYSANIAITTRTLEMALVDFTYTVEDGIYVIDDWKGTYNGVASTECILPNSELVKYS